MKNYDIYPNVKYNRAGCVDNLDGYYIIMQIISADEGKYTREQHKANIRNKFNFSYDLTEEIFKEYDRINAEFWIKKGENMNKDLIIDELRGLEYWDLVEVWNRYCENNNYTDDEIFDMGMFNEFMYGCTPLEIADKISDDFRVGDDYFRFTIWGNVESASDPEDLMDIDDLAEYIFDNPYEFEDFIEVKGE